MFNHLPRLSRIGYPLAVPGPGHAGLSLQEARPGEAPAVLAHLRGLDAGDRRLRFLATLSDAALEQYAAQIWERPGFVLVARDGGGIGLSRGRTPPVCAVAEVAITDGVGEIGISVDAGLRRRGIGTYLVQVAGRLLADRGIRRLRAITAADNHAFIALARKSGAGIVFGDEEVEIDFDTRALRRAYFGRRARELLRWPFDATARQLRVLRSGRVGQGLHPAG